NLDARQRVLAGAGQAGVRDDEVDVAGLHDRVRAQTAGQDVDAAAAGQDVVAVGRVVGREPVDVQLVSAGPRVGGGHLYGVSAVRGEDQVNDARVAWLELVIVEGELSKVGHERTSGVVDAHCGVDALPRVTVQAIGHDVQVDQVAFPPLEGVEVA